MTSDHARRLLDADPEAAWVCERIRLQVIVDDVRPTDRWTLSRVGELVRARFEAARVGSREMEETA